MAAEAAIFLKRVGLIADHQPKSMDQLPEAFGKASDLFAQDKKNISDMKKLLSPFIRAIYNPQMAEVVKLSLVKTEAFEIPAELIDLKKISFSKKNHIPTIDISCEFKADATEFFSKLASDDTNFRKNMIGFYECVTFSWIIPNVSPNGVDVVSASECKEGVIVVEVA